MPCSIDPSSCSESDEPPPPTPKRPPAARKRKAPKAPKASPKPKATATVTPPKPPRREATSDPVAPQPKRQSTIGAWLGVKPPEAVPVPEDGYLVVDLFCSIGGVSAAAKALGHTVVLAVDVEQWRLDIHELNHPQAKHVNMMLGPDTQEKLVELIEEAVPADQRHRLWIHLSPPCQTQSKLQAMEFWSTIEKRREKKGIGLQLVRWALDFLVTYNPPQFSFEEVDDSKLMVRGELNRIKRAHRALLDFDLFNTADYGVPQNRRRVIAARPATMHALRHAPELKVAKKVSLREALGPMGTIPDDAHWYHGPNHVFPKVERMLPCPQVDGKWSDGTAHCHLLDYCAPSMTTHVTNWLREDFSYIRRLSGEETQVLCGFDMTFVWPDKISRSKMLAGAGNAVPPLFAQKIFRAASIDVAF